MAKRARISDEPRGILERFLKKGWLEREPCTRRWF